MDNFTQTIECYAGLRSNITMFPFIVGKAWDKFRVRYSTWTWKIQRCEPNFEPTIVYSKGYTTRPTRVGYHDFNRKYHHHHLHHISWNIFQLQRWTLACPRIAKQTQRLPHPSRYSDLDQVVHLAGAQSILLPDREWHPKTLSREKKTTKWRFNALWMDFIVEKIV